jgi:hypothetical protein
VERAVRDILEAHAPAVESPATAVSHTRCVYIRTHPGDKRLAPVHIAKDEDGGYLIAETGLDASDAPDAAAPPTSTAPVGENPDTSGGANTTEPTPGPPQ